MNLKTVFRPGTAWHVTAWTASLALLAFVLAGVLPKTYESDAVLLFPLMGRSNPQTGRALLPPIPQPREGALLLEGQIFLPTVGTSPNAVIEIVTSRAAAAEIAERNAGSLFGHSPDDRDIETMRKAIVYEVTESGYLRMGFRWRDRAVCVQVVSDLIAFAEGRVAEMGKEFASESLGFLREEVVRRQSDVGERMAELHAALQESPLALVAGNRAEFVGKLLDASAAMRSLEIDLTGLRASLDTTLQALRQALEEGAEGEAYTAVAAQLQSDVAQLKRRMEEAAGTLSSDSPEMSRLQHQFRSAADSYIEELERTVGAAESRSLSITLAEEAQRSGLLAKIRATRTALDRLRDENLELAGLEIEQRRLRRELERAERQLDLMVSQLALAQIAEEKRYKAFVIVDPPYAPERPYFPRRGLFTAAGLGAGFFLGMFLYIRRLSHELSADSPD
ncbi:MAG: hypothetical protein IH851_07535 [Armatimonadetes bacterium]|nr:hypothetical protein [Armatimonadota bacterium]